MARKRNREGESCIDLLERAVHLLRSMPLGTLLLFYVGAVPFIVALLFFLSDMAASPFADRHCAGASLGLALLYLWMRTWHSAFCHRLRASVESRDPDSGGVGKWMRVGAFHAVYSCWSVVLLPVATVIAFPLAWVTAYLNSLCIVDPSNIRFKQAAAKARCAARPWTAQNNYALLILSLFGFMVMLNVTIALVQAPQLLKSLFGVETIYAQHYFWMMNSTFFGIVFSITYLLIDPLSKAIYVLRFSSIASITTGEDILAELKRLPPKRRVADMARAGAVLALLCSLSPARAQDAVPTDPPAIQVQELNQSIDRIMQDREFTWRMPREYAEQEIESRGFFGKFSDAVSAWVESLVGAVEGAIDKFFNWLKNHMPKSKSPVEHHPTNGVDPGLFKTLAVGLLVVLLMAMVLFAFKNLKRRNAPVADVREGDAVRVAVDLDDENLVATLLEEDEWIQLARDMAVAGELRKAVRAWFLAGMAYLSRVDLLAVRASKSNLEYRRELARRARRRPQVVPLFVDNINLFERAWYGLHTVLPTDIHRMEDNLERLRNEGDA